MPKTKAIPSWVKSQEMTVKEVRAAYDQLGKKLESLERAVENKKEAAKRGGEYRGQSVRYCNSDQRQQDAFINEMTKAHKKMAAALGYRTAHDVLAVMEKAMQKAYNGDAYI